MAIPKKIHYCWLSKEKMPANYLKCIGSWKKYLPDYELVLWDGNRFDIDSVPFVKDAVSVKKWAFAADYIRLHAVFTEGGIYLDSDVLVLKNFDDFLKYDFFTSLEFEDKDNDLSQYENWANNLDNITPVKRCGFQAGIFGAVREHPYIKDCMEWYKNSSFFLPDGEMRDLNNVKSPDVMAAIAQKYGFKYKHGEQKLDGNMIIFDTKVFCHTVKNAAKGVYAIHWGEAGWFKPAKRFKIKMKQTKIYRMLRMLTKKKPVPTLDEVIANGL